MKSFYFFIIPILIFPWSVAHASLRINEIAWQGYLGDANNEWIELFNEGGETLNLDGWLLEASDGAPSINLSGLSITPSGFLLLERTDDTTVPEVNGDLFYTGALANTGEKLILKSPTNSNVYTADFLSGWEMSSTSTSTLSYFSSGWAEGAPSPKQTNQGGGSSSSGTSSDQYDEDEEIEDTENEEVVLVDEKGEVHYKDRKATIQSKTHAFVGMPFETGVFIRDTDGSEMRKGIFVWNMGDGSVIYRSSRDPWMYTYSTPGEYIVSVSYNTAHFGRDIDDLPLDVYDEHIVQVYDKALSFVSYVDGGVITLKNNSPHIMDIGGWVLSNGDSQFTIPKRTFVRAGKTITFPKETTKLTHNPIYVINPKGAVVDYGNASSHDSSATNIVSVNSRNTNEIDSTQEDSILSKEEVLSLQNDFESLAENEKTSLTAGVSHSNQKTLTVGLFVSMIVLAGAVLYMLLSTRKTKTIVDGYEIVEE